MPLVPKNATTIRNFVKQKAAATKHSTKFFRRMCKTVQLLRKPPSSQGISAHPNLLCSSIALIDLSMSVPGQHGQDAAAVALFNVHKAVGWVGTAEL